VLILAEWLIAQKFEDILSTKYVFFKFMLGFGRGGTQPDGPLWLSACPIIIYILF